MKTRPYTAEEALTMGWTVDYDCYPWQAYLGVTWNRKRSVRLDTPAYEARAAFEGPKGNDRVIKNVRRGC